MDEESVVFVQGKYVVSLGPFWAEVSVLVAALVVPADSVDEQ